MSASIPVGIFQPVVRRQETVPAVKVCPHCKRKAMRHAFPVDGTEVATYHCPEHGDISPINSAVWRD